MLKDGRVVGVLVMVLCGMTFFSYETWKEKEHMESAYQEQLQLAEEQQERNTELQEKNQNLSEEVDSLLLYIEEEPLRDIYKQNAAQHNIYEQNDAYKMFYGTWEYKEIISQHCRLGGDEGYEELIGKQVTYLPDKYSYNNSVIHNPEYVMSIFPLGESGAELFLKTQEQYIRVDELMPGNEYFVWVQIVGGDYQDEDFPIMGREFFLADDNTMYAFDYNCVYRLERVEYIKDYDIYDVIEYHERV